MDTFFRQIETKFQSAPIVALLDILIVAVVIYKLLMLVRGSRAWRAIIVVVSFVALLNISHYFNLKMLSWLLDNGIALGPVAIVILFLPELRQTLENFNKLGSWAQGLGAELRTEADTVEQLVASVAELSGQRTGALIVIEKGAPLDEIASNGVLLNAKVSAPLLTSIFFGSNPLHDGAVVIRGDTIVAAACRLPLSESLRLDHNVHMRHRAAVGVTEGVDCIAIVVSEERGTISTAADGQLRKLASHLELREFLNEELRGSKRRSSPRLKLPRTRRELEVPK